MKRAAAAALALASILAARSAFAVQYNWTNTSGGAYSTNTNWSGNVVPGSSDSVAFDLNNTYTVTLSTNITNVGFVFSIGNVTLALGGEVYTFTNLVNNNLIGNTASQTARVTISNGTVVGDVSIGTLAGSTGFLTVSSDATWNASGFQVDIASSGVGTLTVSTGGTFSAGIVNMASGTDGNGTVTVSGAGASFTSSTLTVGSNGIGRFTVSAGGSATTSGITVANNGTSEGTLTVTGANSALNCTTLTVGSFGKADATVSAGGSLTANGLVNLATNSAAVATMTVTGASSTLSTTNNTLNVGNAGTATLTIDAGGTVNSGITRIALSSGSVGKVTVSGTGSTWNAASLAIGGQLGSNGGNGSLTINTGGTVNVATTTEVRSSAGSTLTINGGTLNTFDFTLLGGMFLTDGTLHVSGVYSNGPASTPLILEGSGNPTLRLSGPNNTLNISTITVGSGSNGNLIIDNGRAVNVANNAIVIAASGTSTGSITLTGNSSALTTTSTLSVGGTAGAQGGAGVLNISNSASLTVGTLKIWDTPGTAVNFSGGTINVTSLDTSGNPSRFNWTAGLLGIGTSVNIGNAAPLGPSITLNGQQQLFAGGDIDNTGSITFAGGFISANGNFTNRGLFSGYGSVNTTSSPSNSGSLTVSGGMLTFSSGVGAFNNVGNITLSPGATLQLNTNGGASNAGYLNLNSGLVNGVFFFNAAAGTIVGPGNILSPFSNSGTVIAQAGGNTNFSQSWTNSGDVQLTASTASLTGAGIINNGTVEGFGNVGATVANNATVEASGGTLRLASVSNNAGGTIRAGTGGKILATAGLLTNTGTIVLAGGTFDNGNFAMTNNGTITGFGTFASGGAGLTNNNKLVISGGNAIINGNVTNTSTHLIDIHNPTLFTGNLTNNSGATIKTWFTTFTVAGTFTNNGTFTPDPTTSIFQGPVSSSGSIVGGTQDSFYFTGATLNNSGTFAAAGPFQSSANATNSGSFTLSGPQTWSPNTTFTNTAGTATFNSDAGSLAASTLSITLNGGTFQSSSAQHLKAFTMNAGTLSLVLTSPAASPTLFIDTSNGLAFNGGDVVIAGNPTGPASLGYYKIIQYTGSYTGSLANIIMPAPANDIVYYLYDNIDPNTIDVHRGFLGDANDDGTVNFADFVVLSNHFAQSNTRWSGADFDNNGITNFADFVILSNHFGLSIAGNQFTATPDELAALQAFAAANADPVPEPATLVILAFGAATILRKRR